MMKPGFRPTLVRDRSEGNMAGTSPQQDGARFERYQRVLAVVLTRVEFTLADVRGACPADTPAGVASVVRALEKDGFLERFGPPRGPSFRWYRPREGFAASAWIEGKIYGPRIPLTPVADRPRERLLAHGAAALRTAELLAILVRFGRVGESALQAGEKVAARFAAALEKLPVAGRGELKAVSPAIDVTAYCAIMAGIELGRRVAVAGDGETRPRRILRSEDALAFCREVFARLGGEGTQEECHVVSLDTKHQVIGKHPIAVGSLDASVIQPREVFRPAIKDAAAAIVLVHNHPSGDPTPSPEDLAFTRRMEDAGKSLGIEVLDHVIVARAGALSIREYRRYV
jgi:DNA repair protein RadC